MPLLMLKDLPRYECLLEAAQEFPDLDPSATEAFLHVLRAGDETFRVAGTSLARNHISDGRFGVLMALWTSCQRGGPDASLSPAEIAERTGVTRATVTGLVDTLKRAGLVARMPHSDDRRMTSVKITARGENLLQKILPDHFRQMAWLMAPLSERERKTLVGLLAKILGRASEHPVESPSEPAPVAASAR